MQTRASFPPVLSLLMLLEFIVYLYSLSPLLFPLPRLLTPPCAHHLALSKIPGFFFSLIGGVGVVDVGGSVMPKFLVPR